MFFLPFLLTMLVSTAISFGLTLLRLALGGPKPVHGQQLKNKTISSSAYGQPWPRCRGDVRLPGNMIWSTKIRTSGHKTSSGGIFGLGQQAVYTETYSLDCAVAFGYKLGGGAAYQFNRIYADGKLIWNNRVTNASITGSVTLGAATTGDQLFTIHTGSASAVTLSIGDLLIAAATPDQYYEVQSPLVLGPNTSGTIGIFPFAVQDYGGGGQINVAGLTGPVLHPSSFDPDPHDGSHSHGGYIAGQGGINFYLGSSTQNPDPRMVLKMGAANSPGYRGLTYIFIYDLQLANYGNRPPSISAEISFDIPGTLTLSGAVDSLLSENAYAPSEYDTSQLSLTPVQGVEFDQENYQDSHHKLMALYVYDSAEIDGQIVFKFRNTNIPAVSVPPDHIGVLADTVTNEPRIIETIQDEQQLPATVWIRYYDSLKQFQTGTQYAKRLDPATNSRAQLTLDMPVTSTGDVMVKQADKVLMGLWADRQHAKVKLPSAYVQLDPTDVFELNYQNGFVVIRPSQIDYGASGAIEIEGVAHDYHHSVAISDGGDGSGGSPRLPIDTPPASVLNFLDVPFLDDKDAHDQQDTGLYVAIHTTLNAGAYIDALVALWHGAAIYRSEDNVKFDLVVKTDTAAFRGTALNVLAAPITPWIFDNTNSLTVAWTGYDPVTARGPSAAPISSSDPNVQNFHDNLAALIKANGEIELLQFVNVTDNGNGTFTFSRLVRGVRGTETMAVAHGIGDVFVLLTGSSVHMDLPLGDRGLTRYYKAISDGLTPDFSSPSTEVTIPRDLMPYAPYNIGGYIDDFGNIIISWTRRTRLGGAWVDGTGGPLSEQFEEYQVDIYDVSGTTVLRTLTVPVQTAIYHPLEQAADFGALQSQVIVHVYQISAVAGRGFPGIGISPSVGVPPTWGTDPYIISFDLGDGVTPTADQKLLEHIIGGEVSHVIFPIGFVQSVAGCRVAPTNDYSVDINWQGIKVATLFYPAGSTSGNLSFFGFSTVRDFTVAINDHMEFKGQSATDPTISGLFWTITGRRFTGQSASIGT